MNEFLQQLPLTSQLDVRLIAAAIDASSNGVVITDHQQPDEPIIYCNHAFEELSGYRKEEIIGHNCRFLQDGDREQDGRYAIREAIKKGEHREVEIRNYRKDGKMIWNSLMISPVRDPQGVVTHFVGIQTDISKRKNAEFELADQKEHLEERVLERTHDLEESETYLTSIFETIRESLVVLDHKMKVISVNEHFCKVFKLSEKQIKGKVIFDLEGGQWNIPELKDLLFNILPHNNPFEDFELENEFPSIGRKVLILNARQIVLKGKYQDRILLAIEDRSEQRGMERRKEDFISIGSHEMKTPLTGIKGNLQLLSRRTKQNGHPEYEDNLNTALRSVDRLGKLVNDLLDVSKIQSGKLVFDYTIFSFGDLLKEAIEVIRSANTTHRIEVSGDTNVRVRADFPRLEQVVINLLSNAIKYSPAAESIAVHVNSMSGFLKVAITDTGIGITQEDQDKIFERFYRAENIAERYPGVGVGLYVCRQIIRELKGTLWVNSEAGKGSVFNFTIPIDGE